MTYRIGLSVRARIAASSLLAFANATAGVDHRNRAVADDESDIGGRAVVLARHQRDLAGMHEYFRRDFAHRQFLFLRLR